MIRRRKSKKQRALDAVKDGAENIVKLRLAWAGGKTVAKLAAPVVAVGAAAAIVKKRAGGGGQETAAA